MEETFDEIIKAQGIYKKMVACDSPAAFKKVFSEAIYASSLTDFYPVVVRAQIAAALLAAHELRGTEGFVFGDYLYNSFGLHPHHFLQSSTQSTADIMERDLAEVEGMFRTFGYAIEHGVVANHPCEGDAMKVIDFIEARRKKAAENAA
ncbi:MAG: hypothetical protein IT560_01280 [Alphaproteobacteria bacterium]|jgi:hypothetical protein|nr:hypothetical protein [Alphaproteobacteria bacterium]